jgi:SAM-dependent methyltransferase
MATDVALVVANLGRFYDFSSKTVVHVGAGGGQFIRYATTARHVVAVDPDPGAVERLRLAVDAAQLGAIFTFREARFEAVADHADVVLFEFCLHEMDEPDAVLRHARRLAPETVVIDHAPASRWAWYTAETEKAARSWAAAERAGIRREQLCSAPQRFANGDELLEKVRSQGEPAVGRALNHAGPAAIEIEMTYRIALL